MSNRVPDMKTPSEECRPCLCGWWLLYNELDLLPDASIAEEARDNGATAIFASIVSKPIIFQILDDYSRKVNSEEPAVTCGLNCDTAIRSSLDIKQGLGHLVTTKDDADDELGWLDDDPPVYSEGFMPQTFNITEDQSIDELGTDDTRTLDSMEELFYSPLPRHLPNLKNKDVLIDLAAAEGNIGRYTRLRRPFGKGGPHERAALMRGIYHHPMFARWCSMQPEFQSDKSIQHAITARYVMSNNVSRVTEDTFIPQIWYPDLAQHLTYQAVLRKAPKMRQVIARAAIVTQSQGLFINADPDPTDHLLGMEAAASPDPWFLRTMKEKAAETGQEVSTRPMQEDWVPSWDKMFRPHHLFSVATDLDDIETATGPSRFSFYQGAGFDLSFVNNGVICSPGIKKHERLRHFESLNSDMIAEMNDPLWND